MPQVINTNIASLNAQRNLNASQADANVALQRLSSGLRINSAKDDAAGLAISTRFESQISGLNMAQRNANDGISLAQTAEGALDEVTANLQRIRELAVQSANATNSLSDRQALNQEVQQRIEEIDRIAAQTSFNGLKILDGTLGTQTFQVGANSGETIGVSGLDAKGNMLGGILAHTSGFSGFPVEPGEKSSDLSGLTFTGGTPNVGFEGTINGLDISLLPADYSGSTPAPIDGLAQSLNTQLAGQPDLDGISVRVEGDAIVWENNTPDPLAIQGAFFDATAPTPTPANNTPTGLAGGSSATLGIDVGSLTNLEAGVEIDITASVNSTSTTFSLTLDPGANTPEDIAAEIQQGLRDNLFGDIDVRIANNDFVVTNNTSGAATLGISSLEIAPQGVAVQAPETVDAATSITDRFGSGNVEDALDFTTTINGLAINIEGATSLNDIIAEINARSGETGVKANLNSDNDEIIFSSQFGEPFEATVTSSQILDDVTGNPVSLVDLTTDEDNVVTMRQIDISDRDGAEEALIAIDFVFDKINSFRAELGAVQNRFESTIANLSTTSENLSASNSRIRDADFAAETAELARTQVLQSAGLSVLAQANARPQQVLQLLQG